MTNAKDNLSNLCPSIPLFVLLLLLGWTLEAALELVNTSGRSTAASNRLQSLLKTEQLSSLKSHLCVGFLAERRWLLMNSCCRSPLCFLFLPLSAALVTHGGNGIISSVDITAAVSSSSFLKLLQLRLLGLSFPSRSAYLSLFHRGAI